jgi:hypothetical protein
MKFSEPRFLRPFICAALGWLVLAGAVCAMKDGVRGLSWFVALWGLAALDLYSLAKALEALLEVSGGGVEDASKKAALSIQALFWGTIKLICLASIGTLLMQEAPGIPQRSLLAGLGSLVVTTLGGGFLWSRQTLKAPQEKLNRV